jgi:hypothetical protein
MSKNKKCCFECGKKVGLIGFKCRCNSDPQAFCASCRFPKFKASDETGHKCVFDFQKLGKEQIEKANPKIDPSKIDVI